MRKIKLLAVLCATAFVGSAVAGCGQTTGEGGVVRVGLHANLGAGAGYSAINQGFFEEEGLTVEPTIGAGPALAASVVAGQIDVSFMGNGVAWNYFAETEDIKLIALDNITDDDRLIATKNGKGGHLTIESSLAEIGEALRGASIAYDFTATPAAFWTNLVNEVNKNLPEGGKIWYTTDTGGKLPEGLDESNYVEANEVKINNVTNANLTTTMQTGAYDFCISFSPVATTLQEDTENFTVVAKTSTHLPRGSETPSTWAVNTKWLENNEETFKKFMNGLVKGMNFRDANPEECCKDVEVVSAGQVAADSLDVTIADWLSAEEQLELGETQMLKYAENIRNSQLGGDNKDKIAITAAEACDFSYLLEACEANK